MRETLIAKLIKETKRYFSIKKNIENGNYSELEDKIFECGYDKFKNIVIASNWTEGLTDREIEELLEKEFNFPNIKYNWIVESILNEAMADYACTAEMNSKDPKDYEVSENTAEENIEVKISNCIYDLKGSIGSSSVDDILKRIAELNDQLMQLKEQ